MENNEKRHTSINRDAEDVTPDHQQSAGDGSATSKDPPPRPKKRKYVEKGTLTEEQLMEEKMRARSSKRSSQKTEEEKREERRAANRLSAFQSRQRRLNTIDELQKTVAELTKENSEQRHQIAVLKKQVKAIRDDNERLRAELTSSDESGSARAITDSSNEALKDGREESHSAARGSRAPGSGFPSPPRGQPSRTQEQNVDAVQQLIASVQSMVNNAGTVPNEVLALLAELQRIQQQLQVLQPPPQYLDQQLPRQDSGTRSSSGVASLPDEQSRRMGDSIEEQEETQDCSSWTQQPLTFAMLQQQQSSLEQISQQQHQQQISQQHQRLQQQLEILRHLNELKKKGKST